MVGLREIRKKKNLNQQRVALDLNITREALSHYENGRRDPSLAMLVKLSEYSVKPIALEAAATRLELLIGRQNHAAVHAPVDDVGVIPVALLEPNDHMLHFASPPFELSALYAVEKESARGNLWNIDNFTGQNLCIT